MTRYELTTLVADEATDNLVIPLIEQHAGRILREELIGQRRLAYPINGLTNAVYHRLMFEVEPAALGAIEGALRQNQTLLRHLLVVQRAEPVAAPTVVDDAAIAALGDVKEMQAAEKKEKAKGKPVDGALEPAREPKSIERSEKKSAVTTDETPSDDAQPTEAATAASHAAVKDESAVDEAARQAALDEKLKSILGK
jgi:ribosomal protein S6